MPSNYASIIADIKSKLEAVTNIGVVHDYYRYAANPSTFITLFSYTPTGGSKHIRGWEITRIRAPEHKRGAFFRHHVFKLTGYLSLKDANATDKTFQALIDDICEKFRTAADGATWYYLDGDNGDNAPCQVEIIEPRIFGEILCHYTEIILHVTERIAP